MQDWFVPPAADPFVEHCLELLGGLGAPRARRMFGGHGIDVDGVFVGLIVQGRLFLKVDAASRPRFEAAGCMPFVYGNARQMVTTGIYSLPDEAIESADQAQPWARLALEAALRSRATKPASARRKPVAAAPDSAASPAQPAAKASRRKPRPTR